MSGKCAHCSGKRLQAKATIGAANDPLEAEADRVADQVFAVSAGQKIRRFATQIQRFAPGGSAQEGTAAPDSVERVLSNPGRSLDAELRVDMEKRFGHDFSRVRVHTGAAAERSAQEIGANAYTMGHNIVFGKDQFAPSASSGCKLLAHELAHVVQRAVPGEPVLRRAPVTMDEDQGLAQAEPEEDEDPHAEDPADGYETGADNEVAPEDDSGVGEAEGPDEEVEAADEGGHGPLGAEPLKSGAKATTTGKWILVKLPRTLIRFDGTKRIDSWGISGGRPGNPTPTGSGFSIHYRDENHRSSSYGKCDGKPIGPNGQAKCKKRGGTYVGADMGFYQEFAPQVGFHRGDPSVLSHGCIHVSADNAKTLWNWATNGTPVIVCSGSGCDRYPGGGSSSSKRKGKVKPKAVQPRLVIGAVNDPLELEAERVAERVLAIPADAAIGSTAPQVRRLPFARQAHDHHAPALESVDEAVAGPGRPLEPTLRREMELRFGHDFSHVRLHTNADAARSARNIDAHAYTFGTHIVFGAGRYAPGTASGRHLLAHELAHVVQQSAPRTGVILGAAHAQEL
jgi:Domain of unknown function (DUF4157)/L,D-transpeptidase catalytic domain